MKSKFKVKYSTLAGLDNPNLSLVLPGTCNAKCSFCFWRKDVGSIQHDNMKFISRLRKHLESLPPNFYQISITGGEPTLSPVFKKTLKVIREYGQYTKIVLTTNGHRVEKNIEEIMAAVNHINISRHHYDQGVNDQIFGTPQLTDDKILAICDRANSAGVDVTLNCVLTNTIDTPGKITSFIKYAKSVNASAVCFRKALGTLKPTKIERHFRDTYNVIRESSCPVCRSSEQLISGLPVIWRAGLDEPSKSIQSVHELIVQPDGSLTSDWNGDDVINILPLKDGWRPLDELKKSCCSNIETVGDAPDVEDDDEFIQDLEPEPKWKSKEKPSKLSTKLEQLYHGPEETKPKSRPIDLLGKPKKKKKASMSSKKERSYQPKGIGSDNSCMRGYCGYVAPTTSSCGRGGC